MSRSQHLLKSPAHSAADCSILLILTPTMRTPACVSICSSPCFTRSAYASRGLHFNSVIVLDYVSVFVVGEKVVVNALAQLTISEDEYILL
jgi:hypothetical protein